MVFVLVSYGCYRRLAQTQGLKQYQFIILQLWRSEVGNGSDQANVKISGMTLFSSLHSSRGESVSLPFPALGHPSFLSLLPIFKAMTGQVSNRSLWHGFFHLLPHIRTFVITLGPPGESKIIYLKIRWLANQPYATEIPLGHVMCSQLPGIRTWTFLGWGVRAGAFSCLPQYSIMYACHILTNLGFYLQENERTPPPINYWIKECLAIHPSRSGREFLRDIYT